MGDPEIVDTVVRLLAIELNLPEPDVRGARSLRHDLKMDSVSAANLLYALEEAFGIELEIDDGARFDTAEDVAALVEKSRWRGERSPLR